MQYPDRVIGIAAFVVSAAILGACAGPLPPAPPPAVAAVPPAQLSPGYPGAAPAYSPPQYGPTAAPTNLPSSAGATSMTVVAAPYAPPPPRVETPPSAPSSLATWEPGHWFWNGTRYDWLPGHYVDRPAPNANWMPGYWQQGPNGWVWIEGRWS